MGVPGRESDPVVVTGAQTPKLLGSAPGEIVAFRYDGTWQQVPVQVDERKIVDYSAVRQGHQTGGRPFSQLAYADPGTFAGADPDPALDGDDEIAAMALDAGERGAADRNPGGVVAGSRTELRIADPLAADDPRYLYLFRSNEGLDPSAGRSYVDYDFNLLSGDYKSTYDFDGVPNGDSTSSGPPGSPEDSRVSTDYYLQHLGARWIGDALSLRAEGSTGIDILDGDKAQVNYGCGRSELTFSRGGGGFIANRSGPVRAIRSYIGANSGTYTQRDHVYYQRSEVTTTYLRVHPGISTISQFYDYSAAADGMTYRNSAYPAGVTIDGIEDPPVETNTDLGPRVLWEQATGAQGSVTVVNRYVTDMPGLEVGSYYEDDLTPAATQCSGYADSQAHGASGAALRNAGQNTDPTLGASFTFTGTRTTYFGGPGADARLGMTRSTQVDQPLDVSAGAEPRVRLRLRAPGTKGIELGEPKRIRVRVTNRGEWPLERVKVCSKAARGLMKVSRCSRIRDLAPGDTAKSVITVSLRQGGADERSIRLKVRADVAGAKAAGDVVRLKPKG